MPFKLASAPEPILETKNTALEIGLQRELPSFNSALSRHFREIPPLSEIRIH
jgi:hypothetical protein